VPAGRERARFHALRCGFLEAPKPKRFRRIASKIKSALFRLRHLLPQAGEGIQHRTSTRLPLSRKRERVPAGRERARFHALRCGFLEAPKPKRFRRIASKIKSTLFRLRHLLPQAGEGIQHRTSTRLPLSRKAGGGARRAGEGPLSRLARCGFLEAPKPRGFRRIASKIKSTLFRLRHLLPQAGEGIQHRTSTRLPLSRKAGEGARRAGEGPLSRLARCGFLEASKPETLPPHRQQDQERPLPPAAPSPASGRRDSTPNFHAPSPLPQGGRGCPQGGRGPAFTPCPLRFSRSAKAREASAASPARSKAPSSACGTFSRKREKGFNTELPRACPSPASGRREKPRCRSPAGGGAARRAEGAFVRTCRAG